MARGFGYVDGASSQSLVPFTLFFVYYYYVFLLLLLLTAFGLECYACQSNKPDIRGDSNCENDKGETITCEPFVYDRCMTANYTMSLGVLGPVSVELRNCSNSLACDPDSQFNSK